MAETPPDLEGRLAALIDHHLRHGALPAVTAATAGSDDVAARLLALARRYLDVTRALEGTGPVDRAPLDDAPAPSIEGFRTIERIAAGGMGEVYKLQDLRLGRTVAAKVIRRDAGGATSRRVQAFLAEAQSLALFSDARIVQIHEFRGEADPPVIIMEFVDGFELGRIGPSLEFGQRARVIREVCDALARAHALGIQHRDLKPSNIMLDGQLSPKILDFGLSGSDPWSGHGRGTPAYIAPEQLDPGQAIDARTDVYALGVTLYELLTGVIPFAGDTPEAVVAAIRTAQPRLPVEIDPAVPEGLQAIALKAMERSPANRYASAREMALDLDRFLAGRPVTARPTQYASTLEARIRPHLDQIAEWLRLHLIYPHEAARLRAGYRQLEAREDDWIVASRALSYSQIALYLGAAFLFAGSVYYFVAHRFFDATSSLAAQFFVLGAPFLGLNVAARWLYRREHQAVAVAFYLAGVSLLPLLLLIWLPEAGLFAAPPDATLQLFDPEAVSNRQLQVAIGAACAWASWLAVRTKTSALSAVATMLLFLFAVAVLADFGLRDWLDAGETDRLAIRLAPLVPIYALAGLGLERSGRAWFARSPYTGAALMAILVLDLLALNGKTFEHLGITTAALQPAGIEDPTLFDTMMALSINGLLFYAAGSAVERYGTPLMSPAAQVFFVIAPFSMLEPLAYVSENGAYAPRYDWVYLGLAIAIAILSHERQRKSFYYAGLVNTGLALYLIALRREWFDRPSWAVALVVVGLATLGLGFLLDAWRQRRRTWSGTRYPPTRARG